MFKRVLQALFSPFVDSKNKPSAEPAQQEQQQAVATDSVQSSIFVPPSSAQPSSLIVDLTQASVSLGEVLQRYRTA